MLVAVEAAVVVKLGLHQVVLVAVVLVAQVLLLLVAVQVVETKLRLAEQI
jgi:hypothetical protein